LQVLNYEFSDKFDKFYEDSQKKLRRVISFHPIKEHPNEYVKEARGAHLIDEVNVKVFINTDMLDSTEAEVTAAEDIVYALLRTVDKFPFALANTTLEEQKLFEAEAIAGVLTVPIHHLVVISRLKADGFWIEALQEKDKQELLEMLGRGISEEPPPDSLPHYNLVMRYIETSFYEGIDFTETRELYESKVPYVSSVAEQGVEIVQRYGYNTSKKCLNTLIDLRDLLELRGRIWIKNTETDLVF